MRGSKIKSPEEVVASLKKLIKKIEEIFQDDAQDACLITHAQFRVIFPIVKNQRGYSIQELSNLTGVDKGYVSRTIADLESKEITIRDKELNSNERNYKILLSENGQKIISEKMEKSRPAIEKMVARVTPKELQSFFSVLEKLTED